MVHNGIEYGDIQLICEAYHLLKTLLGLSNEELKGVSFFWGEGEREIEEMEGKRRLKDGEKGRGKRIRLISCVQVFEEWNKGDLDSYLIEITAQILGKKEDDGKTYVLDNILDVAGQKGTGLTLRF